MIVRLLGTVEVEDDVTRRSRTSLEVNEFERLAHEI